MNKLINQNNKLINVIIHQNKLIIIITKIIKNK